MHSSTSGIACFNICLAIDISKKLNAENKEKTTSMLIFSTMEGKYSWVICALSFLAHFCTHGFYFSYGTLFVGIVDEYGISETKAALVGSISYSLCLLLGFVVSPLCTRFGYRQLAALGSILMSTGLILSSYITSIELLYLTFGIVFSIGASAVYFASLLALAENFDENFSLALGIASSGAGIGGFAFSSLTKLLVESFGLRRTFRYLAIMGVLQFFVALLYGESKSTKSAAQDTQQKKKIIDFTVWKNGAFVIWTIIVCIIFFIIYIPYVHLVNFALDLSIPLSKASSLLGYVSIANCVGRIILGKIADHPRVNRLYLMQLSLLVLSICHTLVPLADSYGVLTVYCFIYGALDGFFNSMLAVIVGDVVGKENLHNAIGSMYLLSSTFLMFGPPLAGYLYSVSGSYDSSFFIVGGAVAFSSCLMFLIPWLIPVKPAERRQFLMGRKASKGDSSSIQSQDITKKNSLITYDSGIDLTLNERSNNFSCTLEHASNTTQGQQKKVSVDRTTSSLLKRSNRQRRTLVTGSIVSSFAVSRLDLNLEAVVDRVTTV